MDIHMDLEAQRPQPARGLSNMTLDDLPEDAISSGSSTRSSLSSSYNSETHENAVKPLHSQNISRPVKRIRSLRDLVQDDNESIRSEEKKAKTDLEQRLKKEFSIEDAFKVKRHRTLSVPQDSLRHRRVSTVDKVFTNISTGEINLPPDGGYGWVCCMCAFMILFSTWGNNSAFGVYLAYYTDNDVFPGATHMDFAWIAGMIVFFAQFFAPFAMIADRMLGFKTTMSIACVFHFAGYILASFATKLWHLYVCQGVVVGIAYSFIFVPACTIIPNWFLKKRAIASGILCAGTGLGGMVYSLSINAMIHTTGDQRWSLRMVAIVTSCTLAFSIFFIKRHNPAPRQEITAHNFMENMKHMFSLQILTAPRLWYVTLWFSLALLGYNMTLFSFASSATAMGLSQHQASVLTAVINAAQAVGRPTMGFVADTYVGRINYSMVLNIVVVVLIFSFWMTAKSYAALLVCGVCLGLTLGVGNVMNSVLIADAFDPEDFAPAWSILNMVMAFFVLFVEVIALSLRDDSLSNPFLYAQIFAGCIFTVALLFLIPLREWSIRTMLEKRKKETKREIERQSGRKALGIEGKEEDMEYFTTKVENYDILLAKGLSPYLKRALYPVKM